MILFSFLLFSPSLVKATWIAGNTKVLIDFVPNLEKKFTYLAGGSPGKYKVYVRGPLNESFTLDKEEIFITKGQGQASFTATLRLPEKIEPGLHRNYICFLQLPTSAGTIATRTEACAIVDVKELYEEPKIEIELKVKNMNVNEEKEFEIEVTSWTKQRLSVKGIIEIKHGNETLKSLKTEEKILESGSKTTLSALFNSTGFKPGRYKAKATVFYDGKNETDEKEFEIGFLHLEILNFSKEFRANEISPFSVRIKSYWNNKIKVSAEIQLKINDSFVVFGETPAYEIKPMEEREIKGYFDATGLKPGNYKGKAVVYYENKKTEVKDTIKILPEREVKVEMPSTTKLLVAVIVLLSLLVVIGIVLIILRILKESKKLKR